MEVKYGLFIFLIMSFSCNPSSRETESHEQNKDPEISKGIKLITLDPGHFHAALVQKKMYDEIDPVVHVYAPKGEEVQEHLERIRQFNTRTENPTNWVEEVFIGEDFFEKLLEEKNGNVVILAGNNARKINYIDSLLEAGLNVLADKPMVIDTDGFSLLQKAFDTARENDVILYDIMTARYNIFSILQKKLSQIPGLFGELQKGTPEQPAITKKSTHHLFKKVSGKTLKRPAWYFDVNQQGEGIVDVSTHFVDLILWECFPQEIVPVENTEVISARRWPTEITPAQFRQVTGEEDFPSFLQENINKDGILNLYSNGEFIFKANEIHGKVSVTWNFKAPEGGADTHHSIMRGTKANLAIRQDKEQNYQPTLYVERIPGENNPSLEDDLKSAISQIDKNYPGITYKPAGSGWEIVIPEKHKKGHEEHFSNVMEKYLQYVKEGELPEWEKQIMLTKYYITTQAYSLSR